ncbi:MAG: rod shape-determining protein MreC [Longimicrobiales bacterium]
MLDFDGTRRERRRQGLLAIGVVVLALILYALPTEYQSPVREGLRATVLRPFLAFQERVGQRRGRSVDVGAIRAQRDSLAALVTAQASLAEENQRLRSLLALQERAGDAFIPADVLRVGMLSAESTFMLDVGSADGVRVGSPVLTPDGLLGVVWSVDEHQAQAIDWTHPEFRVSAMTADGLAYGIVEPRRGQHPEEALLAMTGAPFHIDIPPGRRIVSSGRGGVFPRGIVVGTVLGIEEADTGWRKSYLLRPAVRPEAVAQVLVGVGRDGGAADLSALWHVSAAPDPLGADSLPPLPAVDGDEN